VIAAPQTESTRDERWQSSPELTAAEVFQSSIPLRHRGRRRVRWTAALAVVVLAVLGFASYKFASGTSRTRPARQPIYPRGIYEGTNQIQRMVMARQLLK
jgi:hypothetical protein